MNAGILDSVWKDAALHRFVVAEIESGSVHALLCSCLKFQTILFEQEGGVSGSFVSSTVVLEVVGDAN